MVRLILRRDRIRFPVWVLGIVGVVLGSANGVQGVYATARDRQIYADTIGNSAGSIAMGGASCRLGTMGGLTVFETSSTALVVDRADGDLPRPCGTRGPRRRPDAPSWCARRSSVGWRRTAVALVLRGR